MGVQMFNESRCYVNLTKYNNTENFFKETMESNPDKYKFVTFSFVLIVLVVSILYGIIWFEKFGSDKKRTIINQCVSSICWTLVFWQLTIQVSCIARMLLGPFSHLFCFWFVVLRRALLTRMLLLVDAITIVRYIFIFWLKNTGAFNDEFWMRCVNLWTTGFSIMISLAQAFFPNQKILLYNVCIGYHPENQTVSPNMNLSIEILSILLQFVLFFRIKIQKWQICYKLDSYQQSLKMLDLAVIESNYLLRFSQTIVVVMINVFFVISIIVGTLVQPCFLISRPHALFVPSSFLLLPTFVSLIMTCSLVILNPTIIKVLLREIKTNLCF